MGEQLKKKPLSEEWGTEGSEEYLLVCMEPVDPYSVYENAEDLADLSLNEKLAIIGACEFDVIEFPEDEDGRKYRLYDQQGGNLANIEGERFSSLDDILARLQGSYIYDYFEREVD